MIRPLLYGAGLAAIFLASAANAIDGTITSTRGAPIPYAFVSLLSSDGAFLGYGISEADGSFHINGEGARLVVQPPGAEDANGLAGYSYMPRIFDVGGVTQADAGLPESGNLVLKAYDSEGKLLRWADLEARGKFGGQFMYYTDLNDRMREASFWPVHDSVSRAKDNPREMGLPAVVVHPGEKGAIQFLYWPVEGYGNVLVRLDNKGAGYTISKPGETQVIEVNVALAETALKDLALRAARYGVNAGAQITSFAERLGAVTEEATAELRAAKADALFGDLLRASDALVLEASTKLGAQRQAPFSFGVFQGGPYDTPAYTLARDAGFDLATVLTGWSWCDLESGKTKGQIDGTLGVSALRSQGFDVKVHGAVWLQSLGILPQRVQGMGHVDLREAMMDQLSGLLKMFGDDIGLWEAMNEPANVNTVGMPAQQVWQLVDQAAKAIHEANKTALVNNGHEADYGNTFGLYRLDGTRVTEEKRSYLDWLDVAEERSALRNIDVIGLQFYPGAHLSERLGSVEGPCMTPSWFADTLQRYAAFGRPVHITECSFPSAHPEGSKAGYWGEGWTADTQAAYAEAIVTIAYGHPAVQSFTWWDVTDKDASVINGGLATATGTAKPVLERLHTFIAAANAR